MYKKILKEAFCSFFFFLVFILIFSWTSYRVNPLDIFKYLGAEAGSAVGMSIGVPENPFSAVAKQLEEKENELQEKEKFLVEKENYLEEQYLYQTGNSILSLVLGVIVVLFVLLLFNFYLDYKNRKKENS
jgi:predicted PurR-regulated permease PerM